MEKIRMSKKKISTNEIELLEYTINNGIDLWIFKTLFIKYEYNYEFYKGSWQEVSRVCMTEKDFRKVRQLLIRYLKC